MLFNNKDDKNNTTDDNNSNNSNDNNIVNPPIEEIKKLKVVDENSKSRPYAVMIDNHKSARKGHAGLQDAYIVYEMIVEGGITRLMALFKDPNLEKIGPVRSSRHYYLDYALENDAIYVHFGWSSKAERDISSLKVNNINGLSASSFFRDKALSSPHNAFTSTEELEKFIKNRSSYNRDTNKDLLLNYSIDEINIDAMEGAMVANNISVRYSSYQTANYVYDSVNKVYKRSNGNDAHIDSITKEQYTAKNIIIAKIKNVNLDSSGRQDLKNIGSGEGFYITNGYCVPITWKKDSRTGQTVYKYKNGEEITVNDGNTFIQIQPTSQKTTVS